MSEIKTTNDLVKAVNETDLSIGGKLFMFVSMTNVHLLKRSLSKRAVLVSAGLATVEPAETFAYGILQIARPDLFEEES